MEGKRNKPGILYLAVIVNTTLFSIFSLLHFYWAIGGKKWFREVLPTTSDGPQQLSPTPVTTLMVALGLLLLALITAGNLALFDKYLKRKYFRLGSLGIAVIFLLRAMGDFRFVGFFKTVKETRFGTNDTLFFSPLCLFISLLSFLVFVFSKHRY